MASRPEIEKDEPFLNPEKEKRWQTVREEQKKSHTPAPMEAFLCFRCPDCKEKIAGEIVRESVIATDKKYPLKTHLLWKCKICGYEFAELEEGTPLSLRDFLISKKKGNKS